MRAAVMQPANPLPILSIEDVEVDEPLGEEVLIRTVATGVCHSDLHYLQGKSVMPMPSVLGHEGAGIVEAVGKDVSYVKPGDHVITCLSTFCGLCDFCLTGNGFRCTNRAQLNRVGSDRPRLRWKGQSLNQHGGISTFAEQMLVHQNSIVKIRDDMPLDLAALIGCGVTTGVGAALNTAKVEPGSSVAVFGAGGIGLSAIQGARIAGARMIIAVDVFENKLATAREFGATHIVDASSRDPVQAILDLTGGGADYTFEAIGLKKTVEQCVASLRTDGLATLIGLMPWGEKVEFEGRALLRARIQGCNMGSNHFRIDMPRYVDFYMQGRLRLDEMITRRSTLDEIPEAFRAMEAGEVVRTVLMFD